MAFEGAEVYAYPHRERRIAWGVNAAQVGFRQKRRGGYVNESEKFKLVNTP